MQLRPLTIDNKPIFDEFNRQEGMPLSHYAFAPIFIWQEFYKLYFTIISCPSNSQNGKTTVRDYLCVFARQGNEYYMPILPVPCTIHDDHYLKIVDNCYQFMVNSNRNPQFARIENVPEEIFPIFKNRGYGSYLKEIEYIYNAKDIGELRGNRYKSQRNAYNTFINHHPTYIYEPYQTTDRLACLNLYETWRKARAEKSDDLIYQAMLDDSNSAQKIGISHAEALELVGRVVRINNEVRSYTFGYELNCETFCILFEISDLSIKGLAQYIYREFCKELMSSYRLINAMDDSGLDNLKRVKLAYHPTCLIPSYNITRN